MTENTNISFGLCEERNSLDIEGAVECYLIVIYVDRGFTKTPPELVNLEAIKHYASN